MTIEILQKKEITNETTLFKPVILMKVRGELMMHATVNSSFPANSSGKLLVMDCLGRHPDDSSAPEDSRDTYSRRVRHGNPQNNSRLEGEGRGKAAYPFCTRDVGECTKADLLEYFLIGR